MMLTANVSAEVQELNAAAMLEILSSGTIASGHAAGHNYSTADSAGRFYTTSEKPN